MRSACHSSAGLLQALSPLQHFMPFSLYVPGCSKTGCLSCSLSLPLQKQNKRPSTQRARNRRLALDSPRTQPQPNPGPFLQLLLSERRPPHPHLWGQLDGWGAQHGALRPGAAPSARRRRRHRKLRGGDHGLRTLRLYGAADAGGAGGVGLKRGHVLAKLAATLW